MGRFKVDKKECCDGCGVKFSDDLPYHATNMCQKCYMNWKQPRKRRVNGRDNTKCIDCHINFGELNSRGKLVIYMSSGLCRSCYQKAYSSKKGRNCLKCGKLIASATKTVCKLCQEIERDEYYKNNPSAKKSTSYKQKLKVLDKEITYENYELIRRLLVKFKAGNYNYVDLYRVVDVYVEIYEHEAHLDGYNEYDQVLIMLKRLKDIFDHNTKVRLDREIENKIKLQKKINRLIKV